MVVGGYAVGLHGYPRYTGDLDIWINRDVQNIDRLLNAITLFGGPVTSIDKKKLLESPSETNPAPGISFGIPPLRIEVITQINGVAFDDCFSRVQQININGLNMFYIHYDDLKANKISTGCSQDIADIENLEKRRKK